MEFVKRHINLEALRKNLWIAEPSGARVNISPEILGGNTIIVGMPGAFTKVCGGVHLPSLLDMADGFKALGENLGVGVIIAASDNANAMAAWLEVTCQQKGIPVPTNFFMASSGSTPTAQNILGVLLENHPNLSNPWQRSVTLLKDSWIVAQDMEELTEDGKPAPLKAAGQCTVTQGKEVLERAGRKFQSYYSPHPYLQYD